MGISFTAFREHFCKSGLTDSGVNLCRFYRYVTEEVANGSPFLFENK